MSLDDVKKIADAVGGKIESVMALPDGTGGAVVSFPLPKDHWLYAEPVDGYDPPPMPLRMGQDATVMLSIIQSGGPQMHLRVWESYSREQMADMIRKVGKYAYRAASERGKFDDIDPDALLQNLVTGFLGYWTGDGLSDDEWANPKDQKRNK